MSRVEYNPGGGDQKELTDWYAAADGKFADSDEWVWTETDGRLAFSDIGAGGPAGEPRAQLVAYADDRQRRARAISLEIDRHDAIRIARVLLTWAGEDESSGNEYIDWLAGHPANREDVEEE